MHVTQGLPLRMRGLGQQASTMAKAATLLMVVSCAVVGTTGASSAHVNALHDKGMSATEVAVPEIPVKDDCGPGNAAYSTFPIGPWVSVTNADGSLVLTTQEGFVFPGDLTTITFATPVDSNVACETPTPEVSVVEVLVVKGKTRFLDRCGRASDLFKVVPREGVRYRANGQAVRAGRWLHLKKREVKIRAFAMDETYLLRGKRAWTISFTSKPCPRAPDVLPATGL